MKNLLLILIVILVFVGSGFTQTNEINIIPRPASVERRDGIFELTSKTQMVFNEPSGSAAFIDLFKAYLRSTHELEVRTRGSASSAKAFFFGRPKTPFSLGEYELNVDKKLILIVSSDDAGRFYALQTLFQLMSVSKKGSIKIPAVKITDRPRFPYRGMHLDVARHFMPVSFVKRYIDLMSQYKFNYFHWHLTEDQGWRIEIRKYPRLTQIGSKRPETVKERNLTPYIGDGIPVEGFYTQEEVKDVVAYAKARYITVIPEIELPGHASAALAAYPELGCRENYAYKVQTTWGIFKEVFCPTEKTFQFLEDVLTETIALFPDSPYVHIGGDEVLKDHWKESPFVQGMKKKENLKDEHEVQSYFIRRIENFINSKGKRMIGWDEILEGGLAPNATVMSWRGMKGGIEAAKSKHDVIMTPTDFVYFDYGQGDPAYEPLNIGSYITTEKVYSFDPVPKELTTEEAKYIIGGQANVWTEYMKTPSHVEYMAFPRMIALSEVLWSSPEDKNYADFWNRLSAHFPRLDRQNVNYRIPEPVGLNNVIVSGDGKTVVELFTSIPGSKIHYTIDGSTPNEASKVFKKPIEIELQQGKKTELKTVVVNENGRKSAVYAATLIRREMLQPVELAARKPGVKFELILGDEDSESSKETGETKSILLQQFEKKISLKQPFRILFEGYFNAPSDGVYEFQIDSTWDASVVLGGEKIIDDVGTKDRKVRSAILPLKAGLHKISLNYNHRGGDAAFRFRWGIKGQGLRQAYGGEFYH